MPAWEQRIDRSSSDLLLAEHVARYLFAQPVLVGAELWADLGCGNGVAARDALDDRFTGQLLLLDNDAGALANAERELAEHSPRTLEADVSTREGLVPVREALMGAGAGEACITCFELLEHLDDFSPLVDLLATLVAERRYTVLLSVPNDAFWSLQNPHHRTMWGADALAEFRTLLPQPHVVARQYPLTGTAIELEGEPAHRQPQLTVEPEGAPSHYLIAFGAAIERLQGLASVLQRDLDGTRGWERQRESDLAYFRARAEELEGELGRRRTHQA